MIVEKHEEDKERCARPKDEPHTNYDMYMCSIILYKYIANK